MSDSADNDLLTRGKEVLQHNDRGLYTIPASGLYRVFHSDHRLSHKAILLTGEPFPRCAECQGDVHFELIEAAQELDTDPNFASFRNLRLYEVPHPKKESA